MKPIIYYLIFNEVKINDIYRNLEVQKKKKNKRKKSTDLQAYFSVKNKK